MNFQESRSVLVIQSLGLGDIFFALPVLKLLKKNHPGRKIFFLTHENYRELFEFIPEVDQVITYKSKTPLALFRLIKELRRGNFGTCFVLNPVFRGALAAFFSGIPVRIGYLRDYERKQSMHGLGRVLLTHAFMPREQKMHETERYLDLLRMSGMDIAAEDFADLSGGLARPSSPSSNEAWPVSFFRERGVQNSGPVIAIHAGAGWAMKCWPAGRFAEAAEWLVKNLDARVVLIGGKAELELNERIVSEMKIPALNLAGQASLKETIRGLSGVDLLIANDSGPMHLAAALGIPVVALFGPGNVLKFKPRSGKVKVLNHAMPCSPCAFQYTGKCQNNLCMQEITVEEVLKTVCEIFGKQFTGFQSPRPVLIKTAQRKKILYLQSTSEVSGTDITLLRTFRSLDQGRFEPHVALQKEGPFAKLYEEAGAKVHWVPQMRKLSRRGGVPYFLKWIFGYFSAVRAIVKIIREEKINLVHTNTIHNLYGFLAARLAGVPHVWHIREIVIQSRFFRFLEIRLVKIFSDRFIVMDNAIAEAFLGSNHGFPPNIVKIYDGIELEKFHPRISGERIRKDLGIGKEVPLVGIVCRLDPWKGLDVFLETARKILNAKPDARFLICGGEIEGHGGYENKLKEKAGSLGILDKIYFTGWRYRGEDIPEVYRALDVAVQTPVYPEPYGLANLEAMACGVPVVAVSSGGPVELCGEEGCALLVPPRDPESTARAILSLLREPVRAADMGKAGRKRTEKFFDARLLVKEIENLYEEILKKK